MPFEQAVLISIIICSFAYGFYCQEMARKHISKEKVHALQDMSKLLRGRLPPEEILDEEGIKYRRQSVFAIVTFIAGIILMAAYSKVSGQ